MKIDSIQIKGFGLFSDQEEKTFSPGVSLIYGSNEAGKSTMLNFIISMLYGMKEEDRQSRKWLSEHGKYRPWSSKDFGGKITVSTDKSEKYSVIRDFSEDADSIRIFDEVTGKELTVEFEMDKTKERQFAKKITGLNRSFFLSSVCIKQLGSVIGNDEAKSIASYAQSLIDTGGSDITAAKAIEILGAEVETIGKTERGKVFKRLRDRQEELQRALQKNDIQQLEIRGARDTHSKKISDLKFLSEKLRGFRSVLLDGWIEKAEKKIKRVAELLAENKLHSDKLGGADLLKEFSDKQKDSVIRLETELKQNQDQRLKLSEKSKEINAQLKNIRDEISARKQFSKVSAEELEQFSLNERRWRDLREDYKNRTRQLKAEEFEDKQTTRRLRRLELVFAKLPPHIDQVYLNWERQLSEYKTSIIQENSLRQNLRKMLNGLKIRLGFLSSVIGLFIYYIIFHSMLDNTTRFGSVGIAVLLLMILFISYVKKSGRINKDIKKCSGIIKDLESHSEETKQKIDILFETTESKSGDEFTSKYNSFINLVSGKRHVHQEHLKEDIKNLGLKIKDLENEMLNLLERAFPGIRPDKINPELTEQYVQEARKYLELSEEEFKIASMAGVKNSEISELENEIHTIEKELEKIFHDSGVKSSSEYKARLETFNKYQKYQRNLDEIANLSDGGGIEKLEEDLKILKDERQQIPKAEIHPGGMDEKKAKEEGEALEKQSEKLKKEIAELEGRIKTIEGSLDDREVLEAELTGVEEEIEDYKNYRESLRIAMNQIDAVAIKMHRKLAPQISRTSSDLISLITDGKYKTLKVDEGLNISVSDGGSQAPVAANALSQGTVDQVYLVLRLALAQLFSENKESLPVILDDSFTQYDDKRAFQAMKAFERLIARNQVLIFTCHKRDVDNFSKIFKNSKTSKILEL